MCVCDSDSMFQCLVCEDWIHHKCLFGTHSDDHAAPLSEDDFDMIVCERCVEGNAGVERIAERYAGRDGSGVMLIDHNDRVLGATKEMLESNEANSGHLGSDSEDGKVALRDEAVTGPRGDVEDPAARRRESGSVAALGPVVVETKRKAAGTGVGDDHRATKRVKADSPPPLAPTVAGPSDSARRLDPATLHADPITGTRDHCTAPAVVPAETTPLHKLKRAGARTNLFLANDWQTLWCRCRAVRRLFHSAPPISFPRPFLACADSRPRPAPISCAYVTNSVYRCFTTFRTSSRRKTSTRLQRTSKPVSGTAACNLPDLSQSRRNKKTQARVFPVSLTFLFKKTSDKSTFDLGMEHLLNKMPRAQALDSIRAFSGLRSVVVTSSRLGSPLSQAGGEMPLNRADIRFSTRQLQ